MCNLQIYHLRAVHQLYLNLSGDRPTIRQYRSFGRNAIPACHQGVFTSSRQDQPKAPRHSESSAQQ